MPIRRGLALALLAVMPASAQQPLRPLPVEFEVAAVRPSAPGTGRGVRIDGAQVHFAGLLLREYIARAYQVRSSQIIDQDRLSSAPFDVDAKLPAGSSPAQVAEMLQALLADRFSLKQHREQKETSVYALVVGRPPLKLKESARNPDASQRIEALVNVTVNTNGGRTAVDLGHGSSYTMTGGRFVGNRLTADMLASTLERYCDRPVINMTGLTGAYDVSFAVAPEDAQILGMRAALYAGLTLPSQMMSILDAGGNPLIGAVEQLGLKLEARKAPVDVLVVDEVRRAPLEN